MNEAWICPRCKRVNAPFNPSCFCKPDDDIESAKSPVEPSEHVTDARRYLMPDNLEAIERMNKIANGIYPNFKPMRCLICNGIHASGQSCATLQNNSPPNGEFI